MKTLMSAFVLALMLGTGVASAAPQYQGGHFPRQGIDERQDRQDRRIDRGYAHGNLTPREVRWLESEQRRIERLEWRMRRDGDFTRRERAIIQRELDQLSAWIYRANNNWRRRG